MRFFALSTVGLIAIWDTVTLNFSNFGEKKKSIILICSRKVVWRTLLLSDNSESPRHRLKDHKHDLQHSPLAESLHQWSVYHTCEMTEADGVPCRRLYNGCSLAERTSITRLNLSSIRCKSSLDHCPSGTLWRDQSRTWKVKTVSSLYWQWQASTYLQWVVGVQVFTVSGRRASIYSEW